MNFTQFWRVRNKWRHLLDPTHRFVPPQATLTIFNHSRLFINLDGCVNTLRGECREFLQTNGRDGRNQTAQSRFPCFYNKVNIRNRKIISVCYLCVVNLILWPFSHFVLLLYAIWGKLSEEERGEVNIGRSSYMPTLMILCLQFH